MDFDWNKLWVTICLGIVTISSAAVGAAFFSAGLLDLATSEINATRLAWLWWKFLVVVFVVAIYWNMLRRAEMAMFATEIELARSGTNRRQAVRHIFNGLFFVLFGLISVVFLGAIENISITLNASSMVPAFND